VLSRESQNMKKLSHLDFIFQIIKELFGAWEEIRTSLSQKTETPTPDRLIARHSVGRIPPSEKNDKPMKRCAFFCKDKWDKKRNFILV
jgi:hypothetical protein